MKKIKLLALICTVLLFLPGCWDWKDIETRGFVLGIAIDKYPPIPEGSNPATDKTEHQMEEMQITTGKPMYAMTIQLPIIKKASQTASGMGGSGGGGDGDKTWELTQVGDSFMSMNREMAARSDLLLFYEHLQVIVISEDVAREGLSNILDFFVRDPEMRRRSKVFISQGEAKKILDVQPRVQDYSAIYLSKIPSNAPANSRMIHKTDLGETVENIHSGEDFILPRVMATKDEIKDSGGAVFKGDKMVGWLSEIDLESVKFVRDLYLGGVITAPIPDKPGEMMVLEITKSKTHITPRVEGDTPQFDIDIKVEGRYSETLRSQGREIVTPEYLTQAEKVFARAVKEQVQQSIQNVQNRYGADIFHFNVLLKTEKPDYWEKAANDWHELFPEVKTSVQASVTIRQTGNVK